MLLKRSQEITKIQPVLEPQQSLLVDWRQNKLPLHQHLPSPLPKCPKNFEPQLDT